MQRTYVQRSSKLPKLDKGDQPNRQSFGDYLNVTQLTKAYSAQHCSLIPTPIYACMYQELRLIADITRNGNQLC